MNQQNIQHRVSLAANLKISKTHSCKRSSSVRQGRAQCSSEKVCLMEFFLACRYFCFETLWWSLWLHTLYPFPPTTNYCLVFFAIGISILFRNQIAIFFRGCWPPFQLPQRPIFFFFFKGFPHQPFFTKFIYL